MATIHEQRLALLVEQHLDAEPSLGGVLLTLQRRLKMDERLERVAQYTVRSNQMLTDHALLFERTMAILDRIEQRLEARS